MVHILKHTKPGVEGSRWCDPGPGGKEREDKDISDKKVWGIRVVGSTVSLEELSVVPSPTRPEYRWFILHLRLAGYIRVELKGQD